MGLGFKILKFKAVDTKTLKSVLIGGSIIYLIINGLFWLSSLLTRFLALPPSLNIEPILRAGSWAPVSRVGGRTEPLIVEGPQKYIRHPLYLSAATAFLGWALITNSTSSLVGVSFVLCWFVFVQIPFEERELRAIFGDQYVRYTKDVPMLIPFTRRLNKKNDRSLSPQSV